MTPGNHHERCRELSVLVQIFPKLHMILIVVYAAAAVLPVHLL